MLRTLCLCYDVLTIVHSNWRWPNIPGLQTFQGQLLHSAAWDSNVDWRGKKVAVLGCGSSGVQIVPTLQPGKLSHNETKSMAKN